MEFVQLTPPGDNFIHDISFDYYGRRFATCSTDARIKIWDLCDEEQISSAEIRFEKS